MARYGSGGLLHPLAALVGFLAFLAFVVAGAIFYGYIPDLGTLTQIQWEVVGVVLVFLAIFAYWWEDTYR